MSRLISLLWVMLALALIAGCDGGDNHQVEPKADSQSEQMSNITTDAQPETLVAPELKVVDVASSVAGTTIEPSSPAPQAIAADQPSAIDVATRSGCFACHKLDTKLVGPAWRDVAAHYRNQVGARDQLIAKIKHGGGNWTEITGGVNMPPYSPRVKDSDIELHVNFILSLN